LLPRNPYKWRNDIADNESNPWHGQLAGDAMRRSAQALLGMPLENHRRFLKEGSSYRSSIRQQRDVYFIGAEMARGSRMVRLLRLGIVLWAHV